MKEMCDVLQEKGIMKNESFLRVRMWEGFKAN